MLRWSQQVHSGILLLQTKQIKPILLCLNLLYTAFHIDKGLSLTIYNHFVIYSTTTLALESTFGEVV